MKPLLRYLTESISRRHPINGKRLAKNMAAMDAAYFDYVEQFLEKYKKLLLSESLDLDYAIDCYLKMLADVSYETVQFVRNGTYSSTSMEEVNRRVYANPETMTYYLHGLVLRQFLFTQNYTILRYFAAHLKIRKADTRRYLEVGGGHGIFLNEAGKILSPETSFTLADISPAAIDMSRQMLSHLTVEYVLTDIFNYNPENRFDFISMGEVLEHVEDPVALLQKLHALLKPGGTLFLTTVANAPAIDHIYLFRNAEEIRSVIRQAGFVPVDELALYAEECSPEKAEKYKIALTYACFCTKQP